MPVDISLALDTIAGESTDPQFKGQIELTSVTSGLHRSVDFSSATGAVATHELTAPELVITRRVDSTSVRLAKALLTKTILSKGRVSFRNPNTGLVFLTMDLKSVSVRDIQSVASGPDGRPNEQVTLGFTAVNWIYTRKNPDGTKSEITFAWDFVSDSPV
jgi:type VI protein secretion system component Hcp